MVLCKCKPNSSVSNGCYHCPFMIIVRNSLVVYSSCCTVLKEYLTFNIKGDT